MRDAGRVVAALVPALALAAALAGCGGKGGPLESAGSDVPARPPEPASTTTRVTTVEVVSAAGAARRFDPAAIYARDSPGVVTVFSVLPGSADTVGSARDLRVGSPVAAIGSPFGEPQSLSVGVVSAKNRSIRSLTGFEIAGAIQTDAAINRGNSGGPLVDAKGEVLGINSQIQSTSGGGEGVGYAIAADTVRRTLAELRSDGSVDYAYLGVATTRIYPQLARRFKLPVEKGAWVQEVVEGGPADRAGLRAGGRPVRFQARSVNPGGDIITAVDRRPLNDEAALGVALLRLRPGQKVVLRVYREGRPRDVTLTLGRRPILADSGVKP